jgi:DNA-binding XRE family transcriptional regulator
MGHSIAGLAVKAKTGPGTIIMIEKYNHQPTHETKQKLARALNVGIERIWPSEQSNSPSVA